MKTALFVNESLHFVKSCAKQKALFRLSKKMLINVASTSQNELRNSIRFFFCEKNYHPLRRLAGFTVVAVALQGWQVQLEMMDLSGCVLEPLSATKCTNRSYHNCTNLPIQWHAQNLFATSKLESAPGCSINVNPTVTKSSGAFFSQSSKACNWHAQQNHPIFYRVLYIPGGWEWDFFHQQQFYSPVSFSEKQNRRGLPLLRVS